MIYEEILKKVIDKAEINGWKEADLIRSWLVEENFWKNEEGEYEQGYGYNLDTTLKAGTGSIHWFLWTHDFAKAFFGEKEGCVLCIQEKVEPHGCMDHFPIWKYRLQQMVLEAEPLKYLEKFL